MSSLNVSKTSSSGKTGKVLMNYGLWNATSWYNGNNGEEAIKLLHLLHEMRKNKIEIMGVLETCWFGQGHFTYTIPVDSNSTEGCTYFIYYSGREDDLHKQGVTFILSDQAYKYCTEVDFGNKETAGRMISVKIGDIKLVLINGASKSKQQEKCTEFEKILSKQDFSSMVLMGNFGEEYHTDQSIRKWCLKKGMGISDKQVLCPSHYMSYWPGYASNVSFSDNIDGVLLHGDHPTLMRGQLQINLKICLENLENRKCTPKDAPIDLHVNLLTDYRKKQLLKEIDEMTRLFNVRISESVKRSFGTRESNNSIRKEWSSILIDKCMLYLHCAI